MKGKKKEHSVCSNNFDQDVEIWLNQQAKQWDSEFETVATKQGYIEQSRFDPHVDAATELYSDLSFNPMCIPFWVWDLTWFNYINPWFSHGFPMGKPWQILWKILGS